MMSWINAFITRVNTYLTRLNLPNVTLTLIDILEILILAWLVYRLLNWIQSSHAWTLLRGIMVIALALAVIYLLQMDTLIYIINEGLSIAIITLVVVFQPELRKVLETLGERELLNHSFLLGGGRNYTSRFSDKTLDEIVRGSLEMSAERTGALIVIEQNENLREYERTGIEVDAIVTSQLLINIFEHNTPLHDGAVIIRGDHVTAATCYLPLSDNKSLSKALGTRHRAGVGVSEATDSLTIIVSEETGGISMAYRGVLQRNVTEQILRDRLIEAQNKTASQRKKKHLFRRAK